MSFRNTMATFPPPGQLSSYCFTGSLLLPLSVSLAWVSNVLIIHHPWSSIHTMIFLKLTGWLIKLQRLPPLPPHPLHPLPPLLSRDIKGSLSVYYIWNWAHSSLIWYCVVAERCSWLGRYCNCIIGQARWEMSLSVITGAARMGQVHPYVLLLSLGGYSIPAPKDHVEDY